jgi:hypothetical protein
MTSGSALAINDNAGTTAYSFLKIGVGARPASIGGAYVGLADDYSALYYNPAGITGARMNTAWSYEAPPGPAEPQAYLAASYNSWITDFQSGFLALLKPVNQRTWMGFSVQYMDYGELIETDGDGNRLGTFGASDLALAITGATAMNDNLSLGVTGRVIYSSLHEESSSGLAADVGFMYRLADQRTQIGGAVTNLGAQLSGYTESHKDELPVKVAVGMSHKLKGLPFVFAADVAKPVDDDIRFALGGEFVYFSPFYLRAGFSSRHNDIETGSSSDDYAGLSGGFGLSFNNFRLDYALGQLSELGTTHRVGITARI